MARNGLRHYNLVKPSPEEEQKLLAEATKMRADNLAWNYIATKLGHSEAWFKRRMVEGWAEHDRQKSQSYRASHPGHQTPRRYRRGSGKIKNFQDTVREDAAARLAEIPEDTRDLTGRMCGDPLFERSALAKKQVGA